jgi:hypothetical protein
VKRFWKVGWMGADLTYLTSVDGVLARIRGDGELIGVQ